MKQLRSEQQISAAAEGSSSWWQRAIDRALSIEDRIDSLLDAPKELVEQRIRELQPEALYFIVKEVGLEDAAELLALAAPEQVRCLLDLDCWWKDRFDRRRFRTWLRALLASASKEKLCSIVRQLDEELLCLFLKRNFDVRVKNMDDEAIANDYDGPVKETPDGWFQLLLKKEDEESALALQLVELLYDCDRRHAQLVILDCCGQLSSELEEEAYRLKKDRLADRGFVDYYDALDILALPSIHPSQEPHKALQLFGSGLRLPAPFARALSDVPFLNRALSLISDPNQVSALEEELVILFNKFLAAEQATRLSMSGIRRELKRACGFLNIGLQLLSDGDPSSAKRLLAEEYLQEIFRVGRARVMQLRRKARDILSICPAGGLARKLALLDPFLRDVIEGLLRLRPAFYRGIDDPSLHEYSDFTDLDQVRAAEGQLERIRFRYELFFEGLRLDEKMPSDIELSQSNLQGYAELTFAVLFNTGLANQLTCSSFEFKPVPRDELARFVRLLFPTSTPSGASLEQDAAAWIRQFVKRERDADLAGEFVSGCLKQLREELEPLSMAPDIDPRYITTLLVKL